MKLKPTRGKRPARKGSLASKLNSCIFLWRRRRHHRSCCVQKKIVSKVKTFVTHEGIVKHSVAQFRDMMSDNHRIEYNYIQSFPDSTWRMSEGCRLTNPGDVQFVTDCAGVVTMELKLCCLDSEDLNSLNACFTKKKHECSRLGQQRSSFCLCYFGVWRHTPLSAKRRNPQVLKYTHTSHVTANSHFVINAADRQLLFYSQRARHDGGPNLSNT